MSSKRKGSKYEFTISGEGDWTFEDIVPYMEKAVSTKSDFYFEDSCIKDKQREGHFARFNLSPTLASNIKKLHVVDNSIGKQMIEKFVKTLEKA